MSTEDYEEYLQKTKERPELEEVKRLDYLKFIETATEPRITKNTIVYDALDEEKKIENPFLYSDVMKAVDKQIEKVVSETVKAEQVALDPDLKMRIEKLKEVKRLESIRYLISDEDRMKKDLLDIEGKNIEKIEANNEQNNKI